jgi:hypothetical protein
VSGSPGPRGPGGGAAADSGPFAFGPGARPTTATATPPARPAAAPATGDAAFRFDQGPVPTTTTKADGQPVKKTVRKPLLIAGLPLGFWLVALVGVVAAIGLAIKVFNR